MSEDNQQFAIQKLYVKDISFESPNAPSVFSDGEWKPSINVQLNTGNRGIAENVFEVELEITVVAKQNDKTAFLVELKQAGVFTITGFPEDQLAGMLGAYCPEVLFPFAREAIAELTGKGGFPQLLLQPVDFNALYAQQVEQQSSAQPDQEVEH